MWTASIKEKSYTQGQLSVNVSFTDGTREFNQLYSLLTGAELNGLIAARLSQLAALDTFTETLPLGAYAPEITLVAIDPLQKSLGEIARLKSLVEAGVIKDTDPALVQAIADAKSAYTK